MEREQLASLLLDQSKNLIWIVNNSYELIYANRTYFDFMRDVIGVEKKLFDSAFISKLGIDDVRKWQGFYDKALNENAFEIEVLFTPPDVSNVGISCSQVSFEPLQDSDGNVIGVRCISREITEREKETSAMKYLLESSPNVFADNLKDITSKVEEHHQLKLFESVILNANDSIIITEANSESGHRILFVNGAFTKMTGYTAEEVIGKSPKLLQGPNSNHEELRKLRVALKNWQPYEITTINYKKTGEEFWVNFSVNPVADEHGRITHWIAIERDITQQKLEELEKELLNKIYAIFHQGKSNDLKSCLRAICEEVAKFGDFDFAEFWLPSMDGKTLRQATNYAHSTAGELYYNTLVQNETLDNELGMLGHVLERKKTTIWNVDKEKLLTNRKQAASKAAMDTLVAIPLKDKKEVVGVLLLGTSKPKSAISTFSPLFKKIGNSMGAELSRKITEIELAQIFEVSPDIICVADFDGYIKRINPAGLKTLGYTFEEISSSPIISFVHEEDQQRAIDKQNILVKGGSLQNFETRFVTKEGKVIWLSWTSTSVFEQGVIYAVSKNITEEKRLWELNTQVNSLSKIGTWEIDLVNGKLFWSEGVHKIHETDHLTFQPNFESALLFYREDFREKVQLDFKHCIDTSETFDYEAVIVTTQGREIWVRTTGNAEFENDQCTRIYGSIQNIDEKKRFEIKLAESENRFRTILEAEPACISLLNRNNEVLMINPAGLEITGAKKEENVIGKSLLDIVLPEHRAGFEQLTESVFKGKSGQLVFEMIGLNGKKRWLEAHAVPFKNELGEIVSLLIVARDITIRKKAEEIILAANERFEKVTQATNDAIWDWDLVNGTFYRSSAIDNFFGTNTPKYLKEIDFWKERYHPDDIERVKESIQEAIEDPTCMRWEKEYRLFNDHGELLFVVDRGIIIRDEKGKALRMVGAMTNITQQKSMELDLTKLNKELELYTVQLEHSNEELEQFAFVASHDLQEPLRMISSFMDLLKRKYEAQLDEKALKYIHFATDGALRMKEIILDLLDYSRAGKVKEDIVSLDLNETLNAYKVLRRRIIEDKMVTLTAQALPVVNCYKAPLTQTIHCLLDNAIKYSRKGIHPVIEISADENEHEWIIAIKDNGIGIDKKFFDKIFIIFQRLHNKDEYGGTGIGLSIAKKNIELCGGSIWLESAINEGSTFYFTIKKEL